ncbi:hypothetical protein [Taibaiella sp. KBW10]|uniref:hypothetical protein n=1 Tax=Taibaiella sp. KBW10 TaxID=2153357 RepID=UPI000F59996E|nr:hypothetical protein [Taibaiella sp. KBW10]
MKPLLVQNVCAIGIFLLAGVNTLNAQEVNILVRGTYEFKYVLQHMDQYPPQRFEQRYEPYEDFRFIVYAHNTFYSERKVKQVQIYKAADSSLLFQLELDRAGQINSEGRKTPFCFKTEYYPQMGQQGKNVQKTIYTIEEGIIRIDSSFTTTDTLLQNDTLVVCHTNHTYISKSGKLLNEANTFYNQKYLGKKVAFSGPYKNFFGKTKFSMDKKHVLLRQKLKQNYADDQLYPYSYRIQISYNYLKGDHYIRTLSGKQQFHCYVQKCFGEPAPYPGYNGMEKRENPLQKDRYRYTENSLGLHDKLLFIDPDTKAQEPVLYYRYTFFE